MTTAHLDTLHEIARTLVGQQPLPERLGAMFALLAPCVPFRAARVVVLQRPAWSYNVPHTSVLPWPAVWTAHLLAAQEPLHRSSGDHAHYLGFPICWDGNLLGALELLVGDEQGVQAYVALLAALTPLLASAITGHMGSITAVAPAAPQDAPLAGLRAQLEAPLLVAPLVQTVTAWTMKYVPGAEVALYLVRQGPAQLQVIQLSMPTPHTSLPTTTALVQATANHQQPLMRRADPVYALPLQAADKTVGTFVLAGTQLERVQLALLGKATALIGPALQRALAYQALRDDLDQLEHIFADLPTGLALTSSDGRLLHANPMWARLWGVPPVTIERGQLVPWDLFQPLLPRLPDPIAFDQFFGQSMGEIGEATLSLQQPYQQLRVVRIPITQPDNQPLSLYALTDVTREREAERAKTEFVSVVSHELRTPLTSILGYTELLRARDFPAHERFELVETVWKQATHLSALVEDLLNVSKLDAGRITLTRWVLSIRQLVTELIAQMNKELDRRRHQLLIDIDPNLPPVYADRDRVRQVLSNLLSNAIKYSPDGGEIVLRAQVLETPPPNAPPLPPDPALLITVRDPGIGIEPHELRRVFDRFYRVDNSNTRRIGGTGLGLAITKALVELHGGRIWITSQPGEGTTFWLTLPLAANVVHTTR